MSYQALARKYRPQNFDDVVGQTHVVRPLINALKQNRLHHAYLFTGTRGVGKTTLGRLLAKCFNCEAGITPSPCNTCSHCTEIRQGQFPDLIEVDAASRTKVEDTRELLDNIPYAPAKGRFKVYLIDEVHMLSKHSFNALLKTLEEPPSHVKFLLATTDPDKLPQTIISRCLQFHLKHVSASLIATQLEKILKQEAITFEKPALSQLARAAKGSVRDALTLLDQAIAYSDACLSTEAITSLLGTIETDTLDEIFQALNDNNPTHLFKITQHLFEKMVDVNQLLEAMATHIYQMVVNQALEKEDPAKFSPDELHQYYKMVTTSLTDIHLSPTPKMGLDMLLLRMLAVRKIKDNHPTRKTTAQPPKQTEVLHKPSQAFKIKPDTAPSSFAKPTEKTAEKHQNEQISALMQAFNAKLISETTDE